MELVSVQIGAEDPPGAAAAYAFLLDVEPVSCAGGLQRLQLRRGAVEIEPGAPGLHAITFAAGSDVGRLDCCHGLDVRLVAPADSGAADPDAPVIDHVVVQTADPERAVAMWRDRLGLRLALDRVFPVRGLRLLFFRSGGITLEFAAPHPATHGAAEADRLHGVSYRVTDLAARRERLIRAGIDVSPLRPGMKPGTSVATVRSGTAGVPTLLLEAESR